MYNVYIASVSKIYTHLCYIVSYSYKKSYVQVLRSYFLLILDDDDDDEEE